MVPALTVTQPEVPDDEYLRMAGDGQIRSHRDAARPVGLGPHHLGKVPGEGRRLDSGRNDRLMCAMLRVPAAP